MTKFDLEKQIKDNIVVIVLFAILIIVAQKGLFNSDQQYTIQYDSSGNEMKEIIIEETEETPIEETVDTPCKFHGISSFLNPFTASDCYGDCPLESDCSFSIVRGLPMCGCKVILDTDADGIPNSEDKDDDNDGWEDTVEIKSGTNPLDSSDYPVCYDSDESSDMYTYILTKGFCQDSTGIYWDSCYDGTTVKECVCESTPKHCNCGWSGNCPGLIPGSICDGGKCF